VVVARLTDGPDGVETRLAVPLRPRTAEALKGLRDFLQWRFRAGRGRFTDEEWDRLLGRGPARPTERLALLNRLATTGQEAYQGAEGYETTPNDLGLEHYRHKFAALPDGTPFSLGILLSGGASGQKKRARAPDASADTADSHPFDQLSAGIRLLALTRALKREREDGWVRADVDFRELLRAEASALTGIPMEAMPTRSVTRLREFLKRNGLAQLFPNAPQRRRAQAAQPIPPGSEP
jgi:hypothetical protein